MSKLAKILCTFAFLGVGAPAMAQSPSGSGNTATGSPNDTTNNPTVSGSRSAETMDERPTDPNQARNNKPLVKRLEGDNRTGNESKGN